MLAWWKKKMGSKAAVSFSPISPLDPVICVPRVEAERAAVAREVGGKDGIHRHQLPHVLCGCDAYSSP